MRHLPPKKRSYPKNDIAFRPLRANDLLIYITLTQDTNPIGEGAEALHTLGDMLIRLARLSEKAFSDYLRKLALQAVHIDVLRAEHLLGNEPDRPDCWRNDVMQYLTSARESVTKPDFSIPIDLPGTPEERLAAFQRQVLAYGQLLTHWPAIVEAARAMKSKEDMLARPIRTFVV